MKIPPSLRRGGLAACCVSAILTGFAAPLPAPAPAAPPKTHTLWVGADFAVEWEGKLRPVIGVEGSTFILDVDGRHVTVPSQRGSLNIKIDDTLKMSTRSAVVTDLKGERVYTRENDPRGKFNRSFATGAGASAATNAASFNLQQAQLSASVNPKNPLAADTVRAAEAAYQKSAVEGMSDMNSTGTYAAQLGSELAEEKFDAFDLTFSVSSPRPLEHPYMIVVTRYRETAGDPKSGRVWVYAEKLDPIGGQPRKVRLTRGGFSPGYELIDFRVHLYDAGQEIASSVARKRIELTGEEAFQYAVIDYIGRHRNETLAPAPARAFLPAGLRARIPTDALSRTVYVKVGADGCVRGTFRDPGCSQPLEDSALARTLDELRFHPALAQGKPCDGVAVLDLAQLLR